MKYQVVPPKSISGELDLPISKSMMNRYLGLTHLSGKNLPAFSAAWPEDVKVLHNALSSEEKEINCKDAGTAMRFATAIFSISEKETVLSGSGRMHERPIGPLVQALRGLGADITYLKEEGFPPLLIKGKPLKGGKISLPVDISSQFLSALLLIAPYCEQEVTIECLGKKVSLPYIDLTIKMMGEFGVNVEQNNEAYFIVNQCYRWRSIGIEKDWSSAAFVYQIAALSSDVQIKLPGLKLASMQGDKKVAELFRLLGVESTQIENGVELSKSVLFDHNIQISIDFSNIPDLVQAFVMTCLALKVNLKLQGLYNLHLKESNRLEAVKYNVEALGARFLINGNEAELLPGESFTSNAQLKVYKDHRMAMALAPLALKIEGIIVPEVDTVKKSFPNFWKELNALDFELNEMP